MESIITLETWLASSLRSTMRLMRTACQVPDVVCVAKDPGTGTRLAVAFRTLHPRIEMQRSDVEADKGHYNHKSSQHGSPFRLR